MSSQAGPSRPRPSRNLEDEDTNAFLHNDEDFDVNDEPQRNGGPRDKGKGRAVDDDGDEEMEDGGRANPAEDDKALWGFVPHDERQYAQEQYRDLEKKTIDLRLRDGARPEDLERLVGKSNQLFKHTGSKTTDLAMTDSHVLLAHVDTAHHLLRMKGYGETTFDVEDMFHNVRRLLGVDDPEEEASDEDSDAVATQAARRRRQRPSRRGAELGDWKRIGRMAIKFCRRVPGVEFMNGPLVVQHQKRVVHRARKENLGAAVKPMGIEQEKQEKNLTEHNIKIVHKALGRLDPERRGVNFFRLVVNPDDFGQTVENIFYTSFLIHDQRVEVEDKEDGEIIIRTRDAYNPVEDEGLEPRSHQSLTTFTMQDWENAKMLFNITESAIPHRQPPDESRPSATGWYGGA